MNAVYNWPPAPRALPRECAQCKADIQQGLFCEECLDNFEKILDQTEKEKKG